MLQLPSFLDRILDGKYRLDAILTALSYLRFRKLARESSRKAFDGL